HLTTNPCESIVLCGVNSPFRELFPCYRQVAYALLTRAPVVCGIATLLPLDLHVLSLSLAFILSQDQTLRCMKSFYRYYLGSILIFLKGITLSCLFFLGIASIFSKIVILFTKHLAICKAGAKIRIILSPPNIS